MAVIKCKMCGGDLVIEPGATVAECEYCGSRQTVPTADNEKKLTLFARANRLRAACEFDKAAGVYESIVAEFPQEAEAYWGLVLCKYGIEYVDDPATGRKIPTCHRSSFESVLDDGNFDQAQENADVVARKVYREEAKQIEELRKGIIEVSAKEEPYDIFICYKETDEKGDRTLDSVLAQDIYDALTEKGYRVFFSRITLEDKLGQEYEPYIFAALNSAKIMLAVGTDYEYYNAVWVKNEWSRYLMLMAKDRTKHLIPCYKNIDAYDMPKEFAKLQAQDMGKVGAMQDLLRGIEKILPKQQPVTVAREKVIVGGSGDNKIASLLDRGNMALEDGDWAKADSFFEDVLNNDSKNAQAYLGKALAQERCRTIDALVRKRLGIHEQAKAETRSIPERTEHIRRMAEKYTVPNYVTAEIIQKLYAFDRAYPSQVSDRQAQYENEKSWWENHKLLSRAEKFGTGAVAENFQQEKKSLFSQLAARVKNAQEADAKRVKELENAYDAAIQEADRQAEEIYKKNSDRREQDYQSWLEQAKNETDVAALRDLVEKFKALNGYRDSVALAQHCEKRAEEEQAKREAEAERQRKIKEREEKARAAKMRKIGILMAAVAAAVCAVLVVTKVIIPNSHYQKALSYMENGDYDRAMQLFSELAGYKDSAEKAQTCSEQTVLENAYVDANTLLSNGQYDDAIAAFGEISTYKDAAEKIEQAKQLQYQDALADLENGNYEAAQTAFEHLVDYADSANRALEARNAEQYAEAEQMLAGGQKAEAALVFGQLAGYKDAGLRSRELWNAIAVRETVSVGGYHTVGLKSDGTVVAVGNNEYGQRDVLDWTDIVAVSAGNFHTVGLKSDGTVVAVGDNQYGQCNVSKWQNIVAVYTGYSRTVGIKSDGTVVAVGDNQYGQCDVSDWTDIVAVYASAFCTVGLKSDGTVVAVGSNRYGQCDVSDWTDIVAVSKGGNFHTVGIKSDGTVVAVGDNQFGQRNVSKWQNIVAVYARELCTVGLKNDGTVVAVGSNRYGQCDVSDWTDIVAVDAENEYTVGLKSDGTVVAVGDNKYGRCDVSDWTDIVAVSTGFFHTVGLKSDGTVVAVGDNQYGQCDVSDWTDIQIPAAATIG